MKQNYKKRLFILGMGAFLFSNSCMANGIVSMAAPDRAAEQEARKALPIASNDYEQWPDGPAVGAQGAILMEAETGTILYEKNIHEKLYPASITKVLTCLIGAEQCDMDEVVTMSHDAVFSIPRDSSNIGLDVNEKITVEQCMYGILVGSANEAANALGEHISGSMESFAEMMNERAKELGCQNSHFVTTNGLHDDNHYTTPYDMALIARKFFDNELLCKMSSTSTYYIPQSPTQPDEDLYVNSHNKFLYPNGKYYYEYVVGSKTGYTDLARQTLVTCAEKGGMKLICVVMQEESPAQFEDTTTLFEYGFSNFQKLNVVANETEYTVDDDGFFQTEKDIFGSSTPILSINEEADIVLPVTAVFEDAQSELVYDTDNENSVATIHYNYHGIPVGSATIDLAKEEELTVFDFEKQMEGGKIAEDVELQEEDSEKEENGIVFINVKKVIIYVVAIAGFFILLFVIKAIIDNYQFSKRRKKRLRYKKRKNYSRFDDFDL